jgi:hypothetical protein
MRILTIMVDMLRPNRLNIFNKKNNESNIDRVFKDLGGTIYNNCFTPGPDSPRSFSSFLTGLDPHYNGCNTRNKWPEFFLKSDCKTIFDLFLTKKYTIQAYIPVNQRKLGYFPKNIKNKILFNKKDNLEEYLSNIKIKDNQFYFLTLLDFHWALDNGGYIKKSEERGYKILGETFKKIFNLLNKDSFDHIIIFSDHGFKFYSEQKLQENILNLNKDRANIFMFYRKKKEKNLIINNKLCSISDLFATYKNFLKKKISQKEFSLINNKKERKYVVSEDHKDFRPQINQNIDFWSVYTKKNIYIRSLSEAKLLYNESNIEKNKFIKKFDDILREHSSFRDYEYEKNINDKYKKYNFLVNKYSNGQKICKVSLFLKYILMLLELLKEKFLVASNKY